MFIGRKQQRIAKKGKKVKTVIFVVFEQNRFWILTNIFVFNVDDDDDDSSDDDGSSNDDNDNDSCNNYDDDGNDDDDVDNDDNDEEGKKQFISYVTISSR